MNKPSKWLVGLALAAGALAAAPAFAHGGRVHLGVGINFGPYWGWGPYWGPAWYYPPPYYYPPAYYPPAAVAAPQQYVERHDAPSSSYWYYCESSRGYYPYVKECPGGWRAVPPAPPPAQ